MPWTCPYCRLAIQHGESEPAPQAGVVYRCHVCRLDLVFDTGQAKLVVIPSSDDPKHGG